jgi:type 1 glutamine amidotransferase
MSRLPILAAVFLLSLAATARPAQSAEPPMKVLLIASGPDGHPAATHEYTAGIDILARLLKPQPGVETLVAKVDGAWNEGPDLIGRADCVVLFLSEGAKWLSADAKRLAAFRAHAKRGGGLVVLHWAMGTREAAPIDAFVDLFGACHGGPDRKYKVLDAKLSVADPKHGTASGLKDFTIHDEYYYKLKLPKGRHEVMPVLFAEIDGAKEMVAWSWERPDGGRSFGFSGLHFHANWKREEYRRLAAQGVLWTARQPIPKAGLPVDLPDSAYLLEKK